MVDHHDHNENQIRTHYDKILEMGSLNMCEEFVTITEYRFHDNDWKQEAAAYCWKCVIQCECLLHGVLKMKYWYQEVSHDAKYEDDLTHAKDDIEAVFLVIYKREGPNACTDECEYKWYVDSKLVVFKKLSRVIRVVPSPYEVISWPWKDKKHG